MKDLILNQEIVVNHIYQKIQSLDLMRGPLTGMLPRRRNSRWNGGGGLDQGLGRASIPMRTGGQSLTSNRGLHKGHRRGDQEKDVDKNMARNVIRNQDRWGRGNQNLESVIVLGHHGT